MYQKTEAIVLKTVDFSESSLVVTLFSRDFGKIRALAKGGRRLKGPFESALDLMARILVTFLPKRGDVLDLLTESKLLARFRPEPKNFAGLYAGYYVIELLDDMTVEENPSPELFDLATETLEMLAEGETVISCLMRFEWQLLEQVGSFPLFDACVQCGREMPEDANTSMTFGHLDGGVLCSQCRTGRQQLSTVSMKTARFAAELAVSDRVSWKEIPLELPALRQMRGLLNQYICHLIGKRPKMFDYFKIMVGKDKDVQDNKT